MVKSSIPSDALALGWVELLLLSRYYQSAQKAKPNQDCENILGSCWVSLGQPNLRVLLRLIELL
ncbi:hypothetical protein MiTe_01430 [Microcystis aeruginosa NIES-2520]|uniref:Uncharacterized protein n=1 Tax=Microcystis aeruginosa NIES-2520 TaxID=2303982 RepID=A0A5A5RDN7_MICAE|nr:hypothetical protein MiTe_01430 [Microcystis aeruginosa NIES-2520]